MNTSSESIHATTLDDLINDLHDEVLQPLTYMTVGGYGQLAQADDYRDVAARATCALRNIIEGRRSAQTLGWALRHVNDDLLTSPNAPVVDLDIDLDCDQFAFETYRALVGATREAIANAKCHSGGQHVWVRSTVWRGDISVTIEDDGVGRPRTWLLGFGATRCIIERMERAGGTATIGDARTRGTIVMLRMPHHHMSARAGADRSLAT